MARRIWSLHAGSGEDASPVPELSNLGGAAKGIRVWSQRLRGGMREGIDLIEIDNGALRFAVIPQRGLGIWKAWAGSLEFGWQSPVFGPVHPHWVNLADPSGLGWLDGFDELLCRCGLESNGAPVHDDRGRLLFPLHGRIANLPARGVEVAADDVTGEIEVTGEVDETRFHFQKLRLRATYLTRAGSRGLRVVDRVENRSDAPAEMELLYHVNFGLPLLDAGSRLVAPVKTLVPRNDRAAKDVARWDQYGSEETGFEEQVYFLELASDANGQTRVLLRNSHGTAGVSLGFNVRQLPCFTLWKNTTSARDGYVTGLEPGVNFPNPRPFEQARGRVVTIPGRGEREFALDLQFHDATDLPAVEAHVQRLQGNTKPVIFDTPQSAWTCG